MSDPWSKRLRRRRSGPRFAAMNQLATSSPKRASQPETTRMFESDLIERFSRIHPVTPFVAWIPIMSVSLFRSYSRHELGFGQTAALFASGVLIWSLTEYVLHRY